MLRPARRHVLLALSALVLPALPAGAASAETARAGDASSRLVAQASWTSPAGPGTAGEVHVALEVENPSPVAARVEAVVCLADARDACLPAGVAQPGDVLLPGDRTVLTAVLPVPAGGFDHPKAVLSGRPARQPGAADLPLLHETGWETGAVTQEGGREVVVGAVRSATSTVGVAPRTVLVFRDSAGRLVDAVTSHGLGAGGALRTFDPDRPLPVRVVRGAGAPAYDRIEAVTQAEVAPACSTSPWYGNGYVDSGDASTQTYDLFPARLRPYCSGADPRAGASPADAVRVALSPGGLRAHSNGGATASIAVLDSSGARVPGVPVAVGVTGNGVLRHPGQVGGSATPTVVTDARGYATVSSTVRAYLNGYSSWTVHASLDPDATDCAGTGCSDQVQVAWEPEAVHVPQPPRLTAFPSTTTATGRATVTVTGSPGQQVALHARDAVTPDRVVRTATLGSSGTTSWQVTPVRTTTLHAQLLGDTSGVAVAGRGPDLTVAVRPLVSLSARAVAPRTLVFSGRTSPARAGRTVTLYRLDGSRRVMTLQGRTDSSGAYRLVRRFSGTGRSVFQVTTGADALNAAGTSARLDAVLR